MQWEKRDQSAGECPPCQPSWLRSVLSVEALEPPGSSLSPARALELQLDMNEASRLITRPETLIWERPEHHGYI